MIEIFSSENNKIKKFEKLEELSNGAWINVYLPNAEEIENLSKFLNIDEQDIRDALDENERSRIDADPDDNRVLIIMNYPILEPGSYDTSPLGIIITDKFIITISKKEINFLNDFKLGKVKTFDTQKKARFLFQICYRISLLFVTYLTQMSRKIDTVEGSLKTSTQNKELLRLLDLNNSLIYFSTSLRANQTVLEKINKIQPFRIYEEDRELLEDTVIENKQSIEMTSMYINVLSGTMDAYASIISNNLNAIMKFMTTWTIVIMLPTFIASLFGMNVKVPLANNPFAFFIIILICFVISIALILFFTKKKFF